MHDYVKPFIEKIEYFLKNKAEKVELLLIGGLAMSFYKEREKLIKFPKDTETFFFRKKVVHLLTLINYK